MRKLLILFIITAITLSALTSCHGTPGLAPFECPEVFDEGEEIEITFWAKNDTNQNQVAVYKQAIADFEALYPSVKVKLTLYTDYGRIYSDVITNISTGTTPNVCITYPDHIATYRSGGNIVVPLGALMDNEKWGLGGTELKFDSPTKAEMVPEFLSEGVIDGEQYALPFMRSTEACYVNKTHVEALGYELPEVLTWDFVFEVSEAAMAKNDDGTYKVNGQTTLIPFIYKSTDNMMIQMLEQKDAGYSTENGNVEIFNDTTEGILKEIAEHAKSRSFSTFKISGYPANYLNAGQCIFAVDSTAGATWMGSDAPLVDIAEDSIVKFETAVMTVPQYDTENPEMISQGPSVCIFNKENENEVLASWLFTQFLLTDSVQIGYATTEGYVPVTRKAQSSDEYQDYLAREGENNDFYYDVKLKATKLLIENTENTFVTNVYNGSASLRNAAGQLIENTTKSVRRGETVDDSYFDRLYAEMTSLYHLGGITGQYSEKTASLPAGAVALIVSLCAIWLLIALYYLYGLLKKLKYRDKP